MTEEAAAVADLCTALEDLPHPFVGAEKGRDAGSSSRVRVRRGTLEGADATSRTIALVTTGVGTAAASTVASWAIGAFSPAGIVSVGSCGGLGRDITVGTVTVGESYAYSLAEARMFGYKVGQVPGAPSVFEGEGRRLTPPIVDAARGVGLEACSGLMLSGDAFVTATEAEPIREKFPKALSADMESAAHAHTAHLYGIEYVAIRAVSDLCSPRANEEFHIGLEIAAEHSARALQASLAHLPRHA